MDETLRPLRAGDGSGLRIPPLWPPLLTEQNRDTDTHDRKHRNNPPPHHPPTPFFPPWRREHQANRTETRENIGNGQNQHEPPETDRQNGLCGVLSLVGPCDDDHPERSQR